MDLVTIRHEPLGLWVSEYPVFVPPLDAVLVFSHLAAIELAERWSTDLIYLDHSMEYDCMVFLPSELLPTVKWAGEYLKL
jgi:hypothetical protein